LRRRRPDGTFRAAHAPQIPGIPRPRGLLLIGAAFPIALDQDTVKNIAFLARIKVPAEARPGLARELSRIIGWVEQLNEVDTEGVEPMTSVADMSLYRRRDEVTDGNCREKVLANAPEVEAGASPCRRWSSDGRVDRSHHRPGGRGTGRWRLHRRRIGRGAPQGHGGAREAQYLHYRDAEIACRQATESDARRAAGQAKGPLDGIPIGIKDLFCTEGCRPRRLPTSSTASSRPTNIDGDAPVVRGRCGDVWARPTSTSSPWARAT
jgi:aspartyl-tRNA(Asn)/glutamyl-tRNA(Gln) amidotransferase subunit C